MKILDSIRDYFYESVLTQRGANRPQRSITNLNDKKIDHKADINIFNRKAVNWYGVPIDERVDAYCNKNFDLLICAMTTDSKPLEYIAYLSKAKYRVGRFAENKTRLYDLMIQVDVNHDLNYLLQQMTHFLESIKYN